jgi:DHA1 family bicyclomycin/chloramphenicol resistance-like MFS transporter
MGAVALLNVLLNLLLAPQAWWALPVIAVFAFGWALMVPVVTLQVLDRYPERRGMASSLQSCIGSAANAVVAGAVVPLVMHSTVALSLASLALLCIGLFAWMRVKREIDAG